MRSRLAPLAAELTAAAGRRPHDTAISDVLRVLAQTYPLDSATDGAQPGAPGADRLSVLAERFGLQPGSTALLLVAVAPALDANVGLAYDLLTARSLRGRVTVGLALELVRVPTASAASEDLLGPAGELRRHGLIDVTGSDGWLDREISVSDRVRRFLAGSDSADDLVLRYAVDVLAYAGTGASWLAEAMRAGESLLWLDSRPGTAGVSVAAAAFDAVGLDFIAIDASLAAPSDLDRLLRTAAMEATIRGAGLIVAGADVLLSDGGLALVEILTRAAPPVVAVGSQPWPQRGLIDAPLSIPGPRVDPEHRPALWEAALGNMPGHQVLDLRLTPEQILLTARRAQRIARARHEPVTDDLLRASARAQVAGSTGTAEMVGHDRARYSFSDLVLPTTVEAELTRLVQWASHRQDVGARLSPLGQGGRASGIAALLTGSPGTGKTLAAHVVADELGSEIVQIDLAAVIDKYIGETEKKLEAIFSDAEARQVVLFFDEADSLFGKRSAVHDAHDRYANQEVSYLLQRVERFDGIVLLATNLKGNLDPAFVRRLQFIVHFPDPDEPTRRRLWLHHLGRAGRPDADDPVDVDELASLVALSGGDIRNVVLAAAYDAAAADRPIGQRLLLDAVRREQAKLGRRSTGFPRA